MLKAGFLAFPRDIKSEELPKLALLIFLAWFSRLTSRPKSDFDLDFCILSKHLDFLKSGQLYSVYFGCVFCCTTKRTTKIYKRWRNRLMGKFSRNKIHGLD